MNKMLGQKVRGSKSGRPIMVLFDVLGQRWTLRILWELRENRLNFRELQRQCDNISPTVLNRRLKELRAMNLLDHTGLGYGYTEWGRQLSAYLIELHIWADDWAKELDEH